MQFTATGSHIDEAVEPGESSAEVLSLALALRQEKVVLRRGQGGMRRTKIPDVKDWAGYKDDLDVKYAHKLLFGKTIAEVIPDFVRSPIERASELLYMPRKAFQYYVFAFAEYLMSDDAIGESDAASPFLNLLLNREEKDPGSVMEIYDDLFPAIDFVSSNQKRFEADPEIYGNFKEKALALADTFKKFRSQWGQALIT